MTGAWQRVGAYGWVVGIASYGSGTSLHAVFNKSTKGSLTYFTVKVIHILHCPAVVPRLLLQESQRQESTRWHQTTAEEQNLQKAAS